MACKCKNMDGTWATSCYGTCHHEDMIKGNADEVMSMKSMKAQIEFILANFLRMLDNRISDLEQKYMEQWREGYREGYRDGKEGY